MILSAREKAMSMKAACASPEGDWKLIEHLEDGRRELYNLANDPGERTDLAEKEAERVTELAGKLQQWRERVGAQMPVKNPAAKSDLHRALYITKDPSSL